MFYNAKWITYQTGEYKSINDRYGNPSPYFRHTFSLHGEVSHAELLISSMILRKSRQHCRQILSRDWRF